MLNYYSKNMGFSRSDVLIMTVDDLYYWLHDRLQDCSSIGNAECLESLRANKIDGESFLSLTPDELRELIPTVGERKKIQGVIDSVAIGGRMQVNPALPRYWWLYRYIGSRRLHELSNTIIYTYMSMKLCHPQRKLAVLY